MCTYMDNDFNDDDDDDDEDGDDDDDDGIYDNSAKLNRCELTWTTESYFQYDKSWHDN